MDPSTDRQTSPSIGRVGCKAIEGQSRGYSMQYILLHSRFIFLVQPATSLVCVFLQYFIVFTF
jgi:hypothetical protein